MTDVGSDYKSRYAYLTRIASNLEQLVLDHLDGVDNIDRVSARAKDPERFADKANRLDDDGKPKYAKPLTEIQDQLGVRVIVFYLNDVDIVSGVLHRYLQPIEETALVPDSYWEFGYFDRHSLMAVPADCLPQDVDLNVASHCLPGIHSKPEPVQLQAASMTTSTPPPTKTKPRTRASIRLNTRIRS